MKKLHVILLLMSGLVFASVAFPQGRDALRALLLAPTGV